MKLGMWGIALYLTIGAALAACETMAKVDDAYDRAKERAIEKLDDIGGEYCAITDPELRAKKLAELNAKLTRIQVQPLICIEGGGRA